MPVDARLERDTDVEYEALALDRVLLATAGASLRVVILDACRNNPLARSMQRTGASRSVSRDSLGELDEGRLGDETLVAYAAAAGTMAADGMGRNSPYTAALLTYLERPLEIGILFREVRARVLESTGGEQRPHEYASLLGELPGRRIGSGHGDGGRQRVESCAGAAGNGGTCRSATVNLNCALRAKNNDVAGAQVCSGQLADWMVAEADDSRVGGAALAAWVGSSCWRAPRRSGSGLPVRGEAGPECRCSDDGT